MEADRLAHKDFDEPGRGRPEAPVASTNNRETNEDPRGKKRRRDSTSVAAKAKRKVDDDDDDDEPVAGEPRTRKMTKDRLENGGERILRGDDVMAKANEMDEEEDEIDEDTLLNMCETKSVEGWDPELWIKACQFWKHDDPTDRNPFAIPGFDGHDGETTVAQHQAYATFLMLKMNSENGGGHLADQ